MGATFVDIIGEDGEEYEIYSFDELLPHHVRYVIKCFRGFDHFYETRADNGLLEYVRGWDKRGALPHAQTCEQLLEVRRPPSRSLVGGSTRSVLRHADSSQMGPLGSVCGWSTACVLDGRMLSPHAATTTPPPCLRLPSPLLLCLSPASLLN